MTGRLLFAWRRWRAASCLAGLILAAILFGGTGLASAPQGAPTPSAGERVTGRPPPLPDLLRRYKLRPPWPVAGVDYPVGAGLASTLLDPATLTIKGVAVDAATHVVTVSGDGVVLQGLDFGRDGGWGVNVTGQDVMIRDSSFRVGRRNIVPVAGGPSSTDLRILRCTIDGGGLGVAGDPAHIWSLVAYNGRTLTIEWSWLLDAPQHYVEFRHGRLIVRNSLLERAGFYAGSHVNAIQFSGSDARDSLFTMNTLYNPQPDGGFPRPGEGVQVEAQLDGTIRDTTIAFNTLIATGPALTASYLVAIRQDAGHNIVDGVTVASNYFDASGAYGPFYPYAGGRHLAFSGNMDMVSATGVAPPRGAMEPRPPQPPRPPVRP